MKRNISLLALALAMAPVMTGCAGQAPAVTPAPENSPAVTTPADNNGTNGAGPVGTPSPMPGVDEGTAAYRGNGARNDLYNAGFDRDATNGVGRGINGAVGGVTQGVGDVVGGAARGVGDVANGVARGAGDIVKGAQGAIYGAEDAANGVNSPYNTYRR